ncbi:MAG: zinc ABC transporter substrate-binding protein [Candidatus Korarchaeota archaeon]|nr:zinc ABC transporter substrate-binding protein [Thermoproteota archaeon]MCR8463274.1 zinc ABC transporter substrate-binding protein [Thermoproteota archaeon]MCR8471243.1 zinc ABC transporter substrate-binding protein [Thermoproteota archaeon]MCR8472357.1 zinc ABC transporter substrate-binding protein [Thermoproteota archaeon]MCR8473516.1 zinc ABC transporter substrate-binding protein [Thermoproteota archaeon]
MNARQSIIILLIVLGIFSAKVDVETQSEQKISVVCSLEAFAGIVQRIGGSYIIVDYIIPDGADPHNYALTLDDIAKASKADLIVLINSEFLSLESDLKEAVYETNQSKQFLDFRDYENYGIAILPAPGIEKNYHAYWTYPDNAIAIAKAVKDKLSYLQPALSSVFEANFNEFVREVNVIKDKMLDVAKKKGLESKGALLVSPEVAYIAVSFGLVPVEMISEAHGGYIGQDIVEIENKIKSNEISIALCPDNMIGTAPEKILKEIQSRTGIPIAYVRVFSLGGLKDYIGLLAYNLGVIASLSTQTTTYNSNELCIYLGLALFFTSIAAIVEALVIFRIKRLAEENLNV